MKKYIYIFLILILGSCTKDLDLPVAKSDQTVAVNCLFAEDQPWNVLITRVKSFADQSDNFVEDAKVYVIPENNDTIRLNYTNNGNYLSEKKPVEGIQYQLLIKTSDSKILMAKSSIPQVPVLSEINPGTQKAIYFSNANLSDYEVFPLGFKISGSNNQNFVRFRLRTFNTEQGYLRFSVTANMISTLRNENLSEDFLNDLGKLVGVSLGRYNYYEVIQVVFRKYNIQFTNDLSNIVLRTIKETKVNYRNEDSFRTGIIFSNNAWSSNVSRDIFNVLGEYTGTVDANLFMDYLPVWNKWDRTDYKEEYWLEVVGMSEDYYKYQKSYIKQVVNQSNPFASVIEVYSNIENGVGIFAGYNRQMIHLHDY